MHWALGILIAVVLACAPARAREQVDVELVIAVDVSGSMSNEEHEIQRRGFLDAFADKVVIGAIQAGLRGRIAVTYMEWAGPYSQQVLVPWRIISDSASAEEFRRELAPKPRSPIRGTSIAGALGFAAKLFDDNGIESFRRVIDVSGDGPNRNGRNVNEVRDEVVGRNIVINGLPIMLSPMLDSRWDGVGLDVYFRDCVIGGPAAFVYPVYKKEELAEAIRRKLILELSGRMPSVIRASDVRAVSGRKTDCQMGRRYRSDW